MIMVAAQALVAMSSRGRNCEPPKVPNTCQWKRRFSMSVLASTSAEGARPCLTAEWEGVGDDKLWHGFGASEKTQGVWMKPASYEDLTRILGQGRRGD
jgi:hypothetical protein